MASIVQAQDVPTSFDQLRVVVKSGDVVTVTGNSGGVTQGRILDLSAATLGLQVDGQRREFSADVVRTISRRRHANLATGAKWGFGVAASTMRDHVIFAAPGSSLNLSMAPIVGRDRKGVMFTARW